MAMFKIKGFLRKISNDKEKWLAYESREMDFLKNCYEKNVIEKLGN